MVPILLALLAVLFVTSKVKGNTVLGEILDLTGLDKLPWVPLAPPVILERVPEKYEFACSMFDVTNNPRYKPGQFGNETYCNIYVWDCTKALGCEVPHWVDEGGNPAGMGAARELNANGVIDWLRSNWQKVPRLEAVMRANNGFPVVATYYAPGRIGHVAMLLPWERIAQAGRHNLWGVSIESGFGNLPVEFYTHD